MSDLDIDVVAVRAAADGVADAADLVPKSAPVTAGECGSSAVIAAAEDFNLWAMVTYRILEGRLNGQAADARMAATAFEEAEALLAQDAAG